MQYLQVITSNTKSKFKGQALFSILPQQSHQREIKYERFGGRPGARAPWASSNLALDTCKQRTCSGSIEGNRLPKRVRKIFLNVNENESSDREVFKSVCVVCSNSHVEHFWDSCGSIEEGATAPRVPIILMSFNVYSVWVHQRCNQGRLRHINDGANAP